MLRKRVLSAVIGIPPLIVIIWLGNPWFAILIALAALLATYELYRLAAASGRSPLVIPGLLGAVLLALLPLCPEPQALPVVLGAMALIVLTATVLRAHRTGHFADWSLTLAGMLYIGWLSSYLVALADLENGWRWVLLIIFTVFAADTSAYFVGRAWGRHALAPQISPKKTREGAVAGLVGAVLGAIVLTLILQLDFPWWQRIALGLLVGVSGQIGDLAESAIKRGLGAKDAGGLIPGHGGLLDRLDSILFSGIVAYYWLLLIVV